VMNDEVARSTEREVRGPTAIDAAIFNVWK
jgi:hypothetical protein